MSIIRLATTKDLEKLYEYRLSFIKSLQQPNTNPSPILTNLYETFKIVTHDYLSIHINDGTLLAFIALENDEIVSSCLVSLYEVLPTPKNLSGKEGTILNVYTLPSYRKQGLATTLLTQAFEYAKMHDINILHLTATTEGFSLYKKLGFAFHETEMHWTPSSCPLY